MMPIRGLALALCALAMPGGSAHAQCAAPPKAVQTYLTQHPGWALLTAESLESYDRAAWKKYHPNECPGLARARLDGSHRNYFVLNLVKPDGTGFDVRLIVLRAERGHTRTWTLLDDHEAARCVIYRQPPGTYVDQITFRHIHIRHDSIEFEEIEAGALQYYLVRGKFRSLQASE